MNQYTFLILSMALLAETIIAGVFLPNFTGETATTISHLNTLSSDI
jgi:hypothetical protein